MRKFKIASFLVIFALSATSLFAAPFFSGYAGGKANSSAVENSAGKFDPSLKVQAFFSGQFNFSQNIWSHLEFSIDTSDLIESSIFHSTPAEFQLDEFSVIFRQSLDLLNNYISVFMGTYDPIGSDIFLQRHFGINSITSMTTESWLGLAGSLLYPHFGIGVADVIRFVPPLATGAYFYFNHEADNKDCYVFNADLRFGCSLPAFTVDIAGGLGVPIEKKYKGEDVLLVVDTLLGHAGLTMLVGNNYTQSIFLQAGIYNAPLTAKSEGFQVDLSKDVYILFEPRLRSNTMKIHFTIYSLPQDTVDKLTFLHDTFGINLNFFYDAFASRTGSLSVGTHLSMSFENCNFMNLKDPISLFSKDDGSLNFNIHFTPYLKTKLFRGELNAMLDINFMAFARKKWYEPFELSVGYKASL